MNAILSRKGDISPPLVLTVMIGIFLIVAAFGSWLPGMVVDRYTRQFVPVMTWWSGLILPEDAAASAGAVLGRVAQVAVGIIELVAGVMLIVGVFNPARRRLMFDLGYAIPIVLFSSFMVTLFIIHQRELPAWNQYPAILTMLAVAWYLASGAGSNTNE